MKPSEIVINNLDKSFSQLCKMTGLELEEVLLIIKNYNQSLKYEDIVKYTVERGNYRLVKVRDHADDNIKNITVISNYDTFILVESERGIKTCILKVDLIIGNTKLIRRK